MVVGRKFLEFEMPMGYTKKKKIQKTDEQTTGYTGLKLNHKSAIEFSIWNHRHIA